MANEPLYSIKGITPGVTSIDEAAILLSPLDPESSLKRGRAQLWCVNVTRTWFTVARSPVETIWLMFWDQTLAAIEGDFPYRDIWDVKAAFAHKFGQGISSWANDGSTALVEVDEGGRCYFQVAHRALFERYTFKLKDQLAEERAKHLQKVCSDM